MFLTKVNQVKQDGIVMPDINLYIHPLYLWNAMHRNNGNIKIKNLIHAHFRQSADVPLVYAPALTTVASTAACCWSLSA